MTNQIELLKERIQSNKQQLRLLKQQKAQLTDSEEIKKTARAIEDINIDIKQCKRQIALAASIEREFQCLSIDD